MTKPSPHNYSIHNTKRMKWKKREGSEREENYSNSLGKWPIFPFAYITICIYLFICIYCICLSICTYCISFHLHILPENGRKTYDCVLINAWFRGFEDDPSVMAEVFDFQHWKNLKFTWFWRKCLILNAVSKGALYLGDCIIIPCYN